MVLDIEKVEEVPPPARSLGKKCRLATKDGVFSNLMAKPEVIHIDQLEPNTNKPPTYSQAALNMPPTYQDALYLSNDLDQVLIDNWEVGNGAIFFVHLVGGVIFQFVGVIVGMVLTKSHAGWYGSLAGLGITLVIASIAIEDNPSLDRDTRSILGLALFFVGYVLFMMSVFVYQNIVDRARTVRIEMFHSSDDF